MASLLSIGRLTLRRFSSQRSFSSKLDQQILEDSIKALGGTPLKSTAFSMPPPKGITESELFNCLKLSEVELKGMPAVTLREVGNAYLRGNQIGQDEAQAVYFWQLAKMNGDKDATHSLALALYKGDGIQINKREAVEELENLVKDDHVLAKYSLAKIIIDESSQQEESDNTLVSLIGNETRALELYKSAAKGGVLRALNNVANMYANGIGTSQDDRIALKWYEAAAEMGDPVAMFTLASWYNTGRLGEEEWEKGFKWNELAAMAGYPRAQYNLGFHLFVGKGVEKDIPKAIEWFQMAAERGIGEACVNLGEIYRVGMGTKADFSRSKYWHQKAVGYGSQVAQDILEDEKSFTYISSDEAEAESPSSSSK